MSEKNLQRAVCKYLRAKYPSVIFRSDLGGIKLTIGQAVQVKAIQHTRAFPDLMICERRGESGALFLELKQKGERVLLKNGTLSKDKHIQEQFAMLQELNKRGYLALFAVGLDQAILLIDGYLKGGLGSVKENWVTMSSETQTTGRGH